jgi:hypothetical protein
MVGRPRLDDDLIDEIERLSLNPKNTAPSIAAQLERDPRFAGRAPALETVKKYLRRSRARRRVGEPWQLEPDADPDPRTVLDVLAVVVEETRGGVSHLTDREAGWVSTIVRAAPSIPLWDAWVLGRLAGEQPERIPAIQTWLAFEPWTTAGWQRYDAVRAAGAVGEPPLSYLPGGKRYESVSDLQARDHDEPGGPGEGDQR